MGANCSPHFLSVPRETIGKNKMDYINRPRTKKVTFDFFKILGWLGAVNMVIFSFTLVLPFAFFGLGFLTIQAVKEKMNNLILLNLVSLFGFLTQIF
jgi:hypothetical protein